MTEIDVVYTAANGTKETDSDEARTLESLFSDDLPPVCSLKAQTGEAFGASGVMQASVAAIALAEDQSVMLNTREQTDPQFHHMFKMKIPLVDSPQKVIIKGHDLAGNYSCLILEKYYRDK